MKFQVKIRKLMMKITLITIYWKIVSETSHLQFTIKRMSLTLTTSQLIFIRRKLRLRNLPTFVLYHKLVPNLRKAISLNFHKILKFHHRVVFRN